MAGQQRRRSCRRISQEEAILINKFHAFFVKEKQGNARFSVNHAYKRLADATGFSERSIRYCITKDITTIPSANEAETRNRQPALFTIPEAIEKIHTVMREMKMARKRPTVRTVFARLNADVENPFPIKMTAFYLALFHLGYRHQARQSYDAYIKEQDFAKEQRCKYLSQLRKYRQEGREIFYQDESWINKRMHAKMEWWHNDLFDDFKETIRSGDKGDRYDNYYYGWCKISLRS